ncbi:NFX1-type zinc finger-containing protein 1-like [Cydia pomonella]|uniref:NFX1-type zinc finger-containing protein 1-like n=1 Tax=Cydia pomonella TaxID=82600 RepID=UPI002ADDB0E5|nr:NFX1-type zinc finger-containing protein 1-like [Cydia pomonella]
MDDNGDPGPSWRGRGGKSNRRPWHRPHLGRSREVGPPARDRDRSPSPEPYGHHKRNQQYEQSRRRNFSHTSPPRKRFKADPRLKDESHDMDEPYKYPNRHPRNGSFRYKHNLQRNDRHYYYRDRPMGFKMLQEISRCESTTIIEKINQQKNCFMHLLNTPVDSKKNDVFALVLELVTNVWKSSFEESKKLLLLEVCNTKFIDHLQLYLMQLPYTMSPEDKFFNKYYWTREKEFWSHFISFCECLITVSPATAGQKCRALIEATSKSCLEGLKEKQGFELPEEYTARMTEIRDSIKVCDKGEKQALKRRKTNETDEPPESFRELSVLPSGAELLERRPFLRPNVVEGAYADVEHYLDVQFRLLREDCFGPLREGIHQYIEEPKKRKYDHIRVYQNVKFLEPYVSNQKVGSIVLLDEGIMKMINKVNWAHSKRFLFGTLVLFTKDHCKSFLVGTILERDEKFLRKRQLPVNIVNLTMDSNMYNDDAYIMIECEVYFEPYYHVLKALQDPSFPEHMSMSKYIIDLQKVPEKPAYLTPETVYKVQTKHHDFRKAFTVLQDDTWPSDIELGLNSTQYEAYKLALTHEFAVIQGPPGTGKTFLGVKVAETLLRNAPFPKDKCCMLVICYTNHALDQFLEAMLPLTHSLARIGGRSRNETLHQFNINNLRRSQTDSGYYHARRIDLKMQINSLEHEKSRADELYLGVLSYKTVAAYNEECKILEIFYRGSGIKDTLKHWLFEEVDDIDLEQALLEQQIGNVVPDEHYASVGADIDADYDIFGRDELFFDDLEEGEIRKDYAIGKDNDEIRRDENRKEFINITTSFSLPDKEREIKTLIRKYQDLQNQGCPRHVLRELDAEICHLHSEVKRFKDMLVYRSRTPRFPITEEQDLSSVSLVERWSLYFKWAHVVMDDVKKKIKTKEVNLQSSAVAYEEARMMVDLAVLKETRVVGMTTSGAARLRKLLVAIAPPIVVVEEAAEVLESHIVTSLTKSCQHLILIGDHQQLRPSAAYMRLARHYQLEVSLFERMIRNGVHSRRLGVQHRMRPEIAALVSPHIYPDLQNHRSVEDFPPVRGVAHNLFFFSHDYREQSEDDSSSRSNTQEADLVLRLANYLMQQDYAPEEVTILAVYSGQMFYMRKQRPYYAYLSNVKITVLDNYQGEESKIILLSLVRNNDHDSIGFLGTENRICVALSRAREGLFIFGNMELLKGKSALWSNIATTLESNGSIGTSLKLRCENHGEEITMITSVDDFNKVPEGGCLLNCKYNLPCGHPCPRICHTYDLVHGTIQCTKTCERKICEREDHKCPFKCAKECQPCQRLVDKALPCGHNMTLRCSMDPSDPSIQCLESVTVTLPDCGHKFTGECYMKISDVRCQEKCTNRLNCGHACLRKCHVNNDPDHEHYICRKPCPKAKKGCTANLEGDLGEHKCSRLCWEECVQCYVRIVKKRSDCGHLKKVACYKDVNADRCREKCARLLPCGHHCKKLCCEECGDCKEIVTKTIPSCNHEIEIECGIEATSDHQSKCTEITDDNHDAPCGHKVRLPCNVYQAVQTETASVAEILSYCNAPCGALLRCGHACGGSCSGCRQGRLHRPCAARCHQLNICGHRYVCVHSAVWRAAPLRARMRRLVLRLPPGPPAPALRRALPPAQHLRTQVRMRAQRRVARCSAAGTHAAARAPAAARAACTGPAPRAATSSTSADTGTYACTAPCGALLRCGHACGGSCSGCRQGRLHRPCAARCHQLNICGHRCEEPCNQVCPPCRRSCSVRCPHSACGRPCGAPCTPCTETPCGRSCEHSACKRTCGAPCDRAPCSEACPLILPCGHACRGLCGEPCPPACRLCDPDGFPTDLLGDPYEDDAKLIQLQDCPHIFDVDTLDTLMKCENETIRIKTCPWCREPIINTYRYKDMVNQLLKNDINPIKEKVYGTERQRSKMLQELLVKVMHVVKSQKLAMGNCHWESAYKALRNAVRKGNKRLSVLHLDMYHIYLDLLDNVGQYYTKYVAENLTELKTEMQGQVKMICRVLLASKQKISQQQQADIGKELKRMNSIVQLAKILGLSKNATNPEVLEMAKTAKEAVLTWTVYDEEKAVEYLKKLEKVVELSGIASKEERAMVVRAMGMKAGHWYKCPNGHFYCIGECGGAMQLSKCPDCGAAIGGQRHTLTAGNQHAREMDGSQYAAWSEEANNMANFNFD